MTRITPCLWFQDNAEAAMDFYVGLFPDGRVTGRSYMAPGKLMGGSFHLAGQDFMVLNGRPPFAFNEAVSLYVGCKTQAEIDRLWEALTADGGQESRCGWLKDKYGVSWQIVPDVLAGLLADADRARAGRAMEAMLGMNKIDIAGLERAARG